MVATNFRRSATNRRSCSCSRPSTRSTALSDFVSLHPIGFRDDLIDAISRLPKLTEHVHLPVQSGSNKILKAMHRPYAAEKYIDLVGQIRRARHGIAITTDLIVGF